MNEILSLLSIDWITFITILAVLLFAGREGIEIIEYFKNKFHLRTYSDDLKERIAILEKHDKCVCQVKNT